MHTMTITVEGTYPPREGAKMGSIKDTNGNYYKAWPDKVERLVSGQSIVIDYTDEEFKGKPFKMVKAIRSPDSNPRADQEKVQTDFVSLRDEHNAAMGCVNRWVGQCVDFPDGATLTNAYVTAMRSWRNAIKIMSQPDYKEALNDEIPF